MNTILIIEDSSEIRENTDELLRLSGYNTLVAANGKEGLEILRNEKPDLILCDIMMPDLDGYGVLRAHSNMPETRRIPFIFMTAKAEKADFRKGMDLGADDYLSKPFTGDDLLRIVEARLKKYEVLREDFKQNADQINDLGKMVGVYGENELLINDRSIKKIRKKDTLFSEGDSANFLYFIKSGKIKLSKSNDYGKEYIVDIYKDGDFFGYNALIEDGVHKDSAIAIEDTELAMIPRHDFFRLLHQNNQVALKFIKLISKNVNDARENSLRLAYDSARKRVAEALIFISKKYSDEQNTESPFILNRENISALSGISPESVSRNLTDFKEEKLIEASNGTIRIIDIKKLESLKC